MFKIVFLIQSASDGYYFRQAYEELRGEVEFIGSFYSTGMVDNDSDEFARCKEDAESADFIYMNLHSGIPYFKNFVKLDFLGKIPSYIHSGMDGENTEMQKQSALSPVIYQKLFPYQFAGGPENCKNFLRIILKEQASIDLTIGDVLIPQWDGLYGVPEGSSEEEYRKTIADEKSKERIGILVHFNSVQNKNTAHIDALMETIRDQGAVPLAMYSNVVPSGMHGGLREALAKYFLSDGKPIIDALIVTSGFSLTILSSPGDGSQSGMLLPANDREESSIFQMLDVPVLQAMTTYFTYEGWLESLAGLDSMALSSAVFQTEFDGQIITVPIASTEIISTEFGPKSVSIPIPDRIDRVVRLSINWARLRKTPIDEKKVAIIFHNMPPRIDQIGNAYGLDSPVSVYNLFELLKAKGLTLEYDFENGKDIIDEIINGVTNDGRFLSEAQILERSAAVVEREDYAPWFMELTEKVQDELRRDWGEPPGDYLTVDGKILVPGIINGNLFIGLQPPRAKEEKAEEAYHSTDIVCPYQYIAFYHYLEKNFKADVIVHIGTHGTIEWLPGKEIGLSKECYPNIAIGEMPHLYLYIIDVPGEGAQAKRRTDAVILDYLIPSMTEGGLYGNLELIDDFITQYYHSKIADKAKIPVIEEQIWNACVDSNLHTDLDMTQEQFNENAEACIERIHLWISDLKSAKIKDGLHIFGKVPQGDRLNNMLRLLVGIRNGDTPSLRESLCVLTGDDLEEFLTNPGGQHISGKTNAMVLEEIDDLGRAVFAMLEDSEYSLQGVENAVAAMGEAYPGGDTSALSKCLQFAVKDVLPRLRSTTDELLYFDAGVDGRFVPPGPSGAPSRGNATILPTGRNFYMTDPAAIPGRSTWETGKMLGDQLMERYLKDEGRYPESVAIVVYSGETIKTRGDDIAEILYLYGVRPVWIQNTERVIGLEVVPLEELGRPRIDVTLRISGLFRDTFPNLIERIEDAVNLVASLDEPDEQNFVKKHIMADFSEFITEGMDREQAFEYASLRVFGCPPGTYGAGMDILVNSKMWENQDDFGRMYINWSSHAYGKKIHGTKLESVFSKRMAISDVTIKNISSYEADMLSSDDFYNYHGGLISAVTKERGSAPASYSTNAGDPRHVVTRTIHEETSRIMRSRINNPKWIEGLKEHGFRGATEFAAMVDIVFGWDATSNVVDDWMYESIAQTYLLDQELQDWIRENNPFALHAMSARLLEAAHRGMWDANEETLEALKEIYLQTEGDLEDLTETRATRGSSPEGL